MLHEIVRALMLLLSLPQSLLPKLIFTPVAFVETAANKIRMRRHLGGGERQGSRVQ